jgi:hypothetical protein
MARSVLRPHADAPTLLFQDETGCSITLRVKAGWPQLDAGSTVVLYPQSTRFNVTPSSAGLENATSG